MTGGGWLMLLLGVLLVLAACDTTTETRCTYNYDGDRLVGVDCEGPY